MALSLVPTCLAPHGGVHERGPRYLARSSIDLPGGGAAARTIPRKFGPGGVPRGSSPSPPPASCENQEVACFGRGCLLYVHEQPLLGSGSDRRLKEGERAPKGPPDAYRTEFRWRQRAQEREARPFDEQHLLVGELQSRALDSVGMGPENRCGSTPNEIVVRRDARGAGLAPPSCQLLSPLARAASATRGLVPLRRGHRGEGAGTVYVASSRLSDLPRLCMSREATGGVDTGGICLVGLLPPLPPPPSPWGRAACNPGAFTSLLPIIRVHGSMRTLVSGGRGCRSGSMGP